MDSEPELPILTGCDPLSDEALGIVRTPSPVLSSSSVMAPETPQRSARHINKVIRSLEKGPRVTPEDHEKLDRRVRRICMAFDQTMVKW